MTLFGRTCAAIWGDEFSRIAADTLQVNQRNVQHWAAGTKEVPPGVLHDLRAIALEAMSESAQRHATLRQLCEEIDA